MKSLPIAVILLLSFSMICCRQSDTIENDKDNAIVCPVLPEPSFPGGIDSLKLFVKRNLKYPTNSGDVSGTVFVSFVVKEDGSLSDFRITKGLCEECDQNAIEVFKKMPKWIPVEQAVRMIYPVRFEL